MDSSAADSLSWPESVAIIGLLVFVMFLLGAGVATWLEYRKTKIAAAQEDAIRQLVSRYEQLAESTLDAQQRVAADVSELRSRTASIEQILRTVE
jgi:flagellar basal body-associated protein FliL